MEVDASGGESCMLQALGVQVCDAADVESRVVDTYDTKLELARRSTELVRLERQIDALRQTEATAMLAELLEKKEKMQKEVEEIQQQIHTQDSALHWSQLKEAQNLTLDLDSDDNAPESSAIDEARTLQRLTVVRSQ